MMDRIGRCDVWSVLAHDYGLYGIATRLDRMGYRPAPSLRYDTLDEDQRVEYHERESVAERTGPYSRKIGRQA